MLTVFRPRFFAKAITPRPTPELAAFCTTHSPGLRSTYSLSSSAAVGGLMASIANCCGSASEGRLERPPADMTIRSLQVKLESGARTRSPTLTLSTPGPTARTRPGLVGAGSVGLGNVDILKTVDRVAKSCELLISPFNLVVRAFAHKAPKRVEIFRWRPLRRSKCFQIPPP